MRVLFIGDIVGSPGRRMLKNNVAHLRAELGLAAVIANGENSAGGSGITAALAREMRDMGIDAITLGDHTWDQKDFAAEIDSLDFVVRPANYPKECPGKGYRIITTPTLQFAVINLLGRTFMNPSECPFKALDRALAELPKNIPIFVDFHAEATSEKIALAHYADSRVTAVVGTHTHVQTSNAFVLPGGTAHITDLGMTGPWLSSLGRDLKPVIKKFITGMPGKFEVATGPATLEGAIIDFDPATRKAGSIEAFRKMEPMPGGAAAK